MDELENKKILIVDDDQDIIDTILSILESNNIESVDYCLSGSLAISKIDSSQENGKFDIIIIDENMPGMKGSELIRTLRSKDIYKDTMILAITAESSSSLTKSMIELGANDFLAKPFTEKVLMRKLESLLRIYLQNQNDIKFLPVRTSTVINLVLNFDLFHFEFNTHRLILKNGEKIKDEYVKLFNKYNVKKLFIEDSSEIAYRDLLDKKITSLLDQKDITSDEKGCIINDFGHRILEDVLSKSSELKIEKLSKLSNVLDNYISKENTDGLNSILSSADDNIYSHSLNVTSIVLIIVNKILELENKPKDPNHKLSKPFHGIFSKSTNTKNIDILVKASMLHDIGKKDNPEDSCHIKNGVKKLEELKNISPKLIEIVAQHEEYCDGTGLPLKLSKSKISSQAKILSIANYFENHVIQKNLSKIDFYKLMKKNETKFMPQLIEIIKLAYY